MFQSWMRDVNYFLLKEIGAPLVNPPDRYYREWYNDGIAPKLAAFLALARSKTNENLVAAERSIQYQQCGGGRRILRKRPTGTNY